MNWALAFAIVLFCLVCVSVPAWAGCPTDHVDCVTEHGNGKDVGKASVTECWKWWPPGCQLCGGDTQPVKNCQKKYPDECKDRCWACFDGRHDCCLDRHGDLHGRHCNSPLL